MSEVRLPKAVRREMEMAAQLQQQLSNQPSDPNVVSVESLANPTPAPAEPSPEIPAAPSVQQPQSQPQADNWEHKFKTLQGMFKAELSNQVAAQLQQSRQREDELLRAVQQLQEQFRAVKEEKAQPAAQIDPKDVEAFGVELVEMVRRQASAEISGAVSKAVGELRERLEALERQTIGVSKTMAVTAEQAFYAELSRLVPDWSDVNGNQGFLSWLSEADPVYGEPRQVALDRASQSLNAERAAAVFKAFKAMSAAPVPNSRQSELESQVAPSRSGASAAPQDTAKPVITERDIVRFYDDMRRGVYRGREQEAAAIESGINLAIAEGRVR